VTVISPAVTTVLGANADTAIEARRLTKRYGDTLAVDELSLQIERGEVFGLLGPNGAGKTTTILMLMGLTQPTSGSARVDGIDPVRHPLAVKSRVGYLPDEVGFYDDLTARQNLRYTAELNRLTRSTAESRIEQVLDEVALLDDAGRKVGTFSRGMRQRLGVADALIKSPSILILDEPTVNIDPEGVRELLLTVERLRTDQDVTVVLSSHLLHQVQQVCDRIGIFVDGQLRACGTVDELAATLDDRWSFSVDVADVPDAQALLRGVDGVRQVVRSEGRWSVAADHDIRADLHRAVAELGGRFEHLARDRADLDAIYHRYFGLDAALETTQRAES
jgi:ABC-2 type transport system ATP-binding protein